jgi:hypothetical protein
MDFGAAGNAAGIDQIKLPAAAMRRVTTLRPSALKRGCRSQRHSPVYSGGE